MSKVKSYLSLIKFSHTIFAMPFALIGFFLGIFSDIVVEYGVGQWNLNKTVEKGWQGNVPDEYIDSNWTISKNFNDYIPLLTLLALVILCMVFARSAAMAFNRYLDRKFDAKNPRTAIREIPAGIISERNALAFTVISSLLFVVCTFFINRICFYLSPVALAVVLGYSYTKRFTPLCHLILGIGLSLGGSTGYAINPARDLGPRIMHFILPIKNKRDSNWGYSWIPVVGPVIGGVIAALVFKAVH